MKKIAQFSFLMVLSLVGLTIGCQKEVSSTKAKTPNAQQGEYDYLDAHYPRNKDGVAASAAQFMNGINNVNPLTNEGALLGRVLFYDEHLSKNDRISCGSCHKQAKGFADPAQFSSGFEFGQTTRNSMALSNLSMLGGYFWDNRAQNLEEQVMMPVQNHVEMGIEKLEKLPVKLAQVDYYPALFEAAFGDADINELRIRFALAQFLRSMVSGSSKYDEGTTVAFANFSALESMGKDLFAEGGKAACANCHSSSRLFNSSWGMENIGLDTDPQDNNGLFKIPSLRNVAVTAPYMHDGRFQTLEAVVNHYDHAIQMNPYLSWALRNYDGPLQLNLTEIEKQALVAFLKTLTDEQYLKDPKFSDPFK